jgi:hypothetical protein
MNKIEILTFLYVFPPELNNEQYIYFIASDGSKILSEGSKKKIDLIREYPYTRCVMTNAANESYQQFKGYPLISLTGITEPTINDVKAALIFKMDSTIPYVQSSGHISQNTLLFITYENLRLTVKDQKNRTKEINIDINGVSDISLQSQNNLYILPIGSIQTVAKQVQLEPTFISNNKELVLFWRSLTPSNKVMVSHFYPKQETKAYLSGKEAIMWMKFGALVTDSELNDSDALSILGINSDDELVMPPPITGKTKPNQLTKLPNAVYQYLTFQKQKICSKIEITNLINQTFKTSFQISDLMFVLSEYPCFLVTGTNIALKWTD